MTNRGIGNFHKIYEVLLQATNERQACSCISNGSLLSYKDTRWKHFPMFVLTLNWGQQKQGLQHQLPSSRPSKLAPDVSYHEQGKTFKGMNRGQCVSPLSAFLGHGCFKLDSQCWFHETLGLALQWKSYFCALRHRYLYGGTSIIPIMFCFHDALFLYLRTVIAIIIISGKTLAKSSEPSTDSLGPR